MLKFLFNNLMKNIDDKIIKEIINYLTKKVIYILWSGPNHQLQVNSNQVKYIINI